MTMDHADEVTRRLVDLTRDLVLIPSTEKRPVERARCFQLLTQHLEQVADVVIGRFERGGFESMVVTPAGVEEPVVLMVVHLDVIEHNDAALYCSEIREGRIYGPGSGDMKGQVAIAIELFRALQQEHPGLPVGLAITSDEERGGEHGIGYLFGEHVGLRCGVALVPDGGSPTEVTVEEKGILRLRMTSVGHGIHAARPWLGGTNAILALAEALGRVSVAFEDIRPEDHDSDHWYPTFSPTIIGTPNETVNLLPADAFAEVDVRFPPPYTARKMIALIEEAAGDEVRVEEVIAAEPSHLAPDSLFLEVAERHLGEKICLVRASGGSDARFIAQQGIPVVLARPLVGELHALNEWIEIDSMFCFYEVYREYILRRTGRLNG